MRKQILEISRKLEAHYIDAETAKSELLNLFSVSGSALYHIAKDGYSRESVCGLTIEEMKTKQDNCVAHPYEKMMIKSGAVVCEKCLEHYR